MKNFKYIIGIDEVGRGPIAGPVAVGAFVAAPFVLGKGSGIFDLDNLRDSKQLSAAQRDAWLLKIGEVLRRGIIRYAVSMVSAAEIDRIGISSAIKQAVGDCFATLQADPSESRVLLDGGLLAPVEFKFQETIIKGDELEPAIALASIVAKVRRDRLMIRLAAKYPNYGFETHKGYGTKKHYAAIEKFGLCDLHRKSFLSKILNSKS